MSDSVFDRVSTVDVRDFGAEMYRAARAAARIYNDALRPQKMTHEQFILLSVIGSRACSFACQICRQFCLDKTTVSRCINRLDKRGLVNIGITQGRRGRMLTLTHAGHEMLQALQPHWRAANRVVAKKLGAEGQMANEEVDRRMYTKF